MITEIRIYKLKENVSEKFNKIFIEQLLAMMERWKINVADCGFSPANITSITPFLPIHYAGFLKFRCAKDFPLHL